MAISHALRIGIVGAGAIVRDRHLPNLKTIPEAEIRAVCNSTLASAERFRKDHAPDAAPVAAWEDLVASPDIDIIWIGTPPYLHAPVTLAALESGKHVFCQARMAMNLNEAEQMLGAARGRPDLVTALCPPPHGLKGDAVMRRLLGEGRIGTPAHLRLQSLNAAFLDPAKPAHWRQRKELSGLNVMTLGIYVEVLQRWLGPIAEVTANGKVVHPVRHGYRVEIPDILSVLCRFENGAQGVLDFSSVDGFAPSDRLEVYGTEGSVVYDFKTDTISAARTGDSAMQEIAIPPEEAREWTVERDFIRAVLDPSAPRPEPTFEQGVAYMRVIQAVADSMGSGHVASVI